MEPPEWLLAAPLLPRVRSRSSFVLVEAHFSSSLSLDASQTLTNQAWQQANLARGFGSPHLEASTPWFSRTAAFTFERLHS